MLKSRVEVCCAQGGPKQTAEVDHFRMPKSIVGREAIHDYWAGTTGRQAEIHFTVGTFIRSGYMLAAEWTCTYQDRSSEVKKELAGMLLADFYGKQVRHFREYWHSRKVR
jgi:hypothetical protein